MRKFFSSDRSVRSSQNSNSGKPQESNLPSLSPQPPALTTRSPNLSKNNTLSSRESSSKSRTLSPNEESTRSTRTRSLRDSARQKLISVETNLRGITGGSRSLSPGSCISSSSSGSSCGSGLWKNDKTETTDSETTSTTVDSQNIDKPSNEQIEDTQGAINETNDSVQMSPENQSSAEDEVKNVVMFTNIFDLK